MNVPFSSLRRLAVPLVLAVVLGAAVVGLRAGGDEPRRLTATFPSTTSLYEGAAVKVLGVKVGRVERIEVVGTAVQVEMSYDDGVSLPADVHAMIVPPSIVGDRFVQLAPGYVDGPVLADGAELGLDRTGVPLELEDTYAGLDKITAALGPRGANEDGSLSRLVAATARSLDGNGEQVNTTLREMAAALGTLAGTSDDFNGTVTNLGRTTDTLAGKDAEMRALVVALARVGAQLNGQGRALTLAVRELREALRLVGDFARENRRAVKGTVAGLTAVSDQLVRHTDDLDEALSIAPLGLTNLANIYVPKNWTPSQLNQVAPGARTGSLNLRNGLLEDLDVALGHGLGALCASLPPDQRAQLQGFCTTLEALGGDLGALLVEATRSDGVGVLAPVPGATSLGGLLSGDQR